MRIIGKTDTGYITVVTNQELKKLTGITEPPDLGSTFEVLETWKIVSDIQREKARALTATALLRNHANNAEAAVNEIADIFEGEE